jgi:hypothetical protein
VVRQSAVSTSRTLTLIESPKCPLNSLASWRTAARSCLYSFPPPPANSATRACCQGPVRSRIPPCR